MEARENVVQKYAEICGPYCTPCIYSILLLRRPQAHTLTPHHPATLTMHTATHTHTHHHTHTATHTQPRTHTHTPHVQRPPLCIHTRAPPRLFADSQAAGDAHHSYCTSHQRCASRDAPPHQSHHTRISVFCTDTLGGPLTSKLLPDAHRSIPAIGRHPINVSSELMHQQAAPASVCGRAQPGHNLCTTWPLVLAASLGTSRHLLQVFVVVRSQIAATTRACGRSHAHA